MARDVDQLKRDAERARAQLRESVRELREGVAGIGERVTPDALKANAGEYLRARRDDLMRTARRNPVQAAAIGAMAAWPAMRLARSVPLPILMIGAGLFLTSSQTGRQMTQHAADAANEVADRARCTAHDLAHASSETLGAVRERAADAVEAATQTISGARAQAAALASGATEAVTDTARRAAGSMGAVGDGAMSGETAARMADQLGATAGEATDRARDAVSAAGRRATETAQSLARWAQDNPLLVAGLGVAIGSFVASAIPATNVERRLGEGVKSGARTAATMGMAAAANAAAGVAADFIGNAVRGPERPQTTTGV